MVPFEQPSFFSISRYEQPFFRNLSIWFFKFLFTPYKSESQKEVSMHWDEQNISLLGDAVRERHRIFVLERKTDRRNLSELWNNHLRSIGITLMRSKKKGIAFVGSRDLIDIINFKNEQVSNSVCIENPDRPGQFIFIPRDIASKILVLGMP